MDEWMNELQKVFHEVDESPQPERKKKIIFNWNIYVTVTWTVDKVILYFTFLYV